MDLSHESGLIPGVKGSTSSGDPVVVSGQDGHESLAYDAVLQTPRLSAAVQHTALFFFTVALLVLTLYLAFLLWKKHRHRPIATLYKLEGYQYSRLNQNELEVDSVVFYSDPLDDGRSHTMVPTQTEEDQYKPATLQLSESDTLISISTSSNFSSHSQSHSISNTSPAWNGKSATTIIPVENEMSDEDLLQ